MQRLDEPILPSHSMDGTGVVFTNVLKSVTADPFAGSQFDHRDAARASLLPRLGSAGKH